MVNGLQLELATSGLPKKTCGAGACEPWPRPLLLVPATIPIAAGHSSPRGSQLSVLRRKDGGEDLDLVVKPLDPAELEFYGRIGACQQDPIGKFVPAFHGVLEAFAEEEEASNTRSCLALSNILLGFSNPCVMDVKLGTRTFLTSELSTKPRPDLFEKMQRKFPELLTLEEIEAKSITKQRWLTVRDASSTTAQLGYRIDGVAAAESVRASMEPLNLHTVQTHKQACGVLHSFVLAIAASKSPELVDVAAMALSLCSKLRELEAAMVASPLAREHELVGTSVLLVADATGHCGAFWIDFAKVRPLQQESQSAVQAGVPLGLKNLAAAWHDIYRSAGAAMSC